MAASARALGEVRISQPVVFPALRMPWVVLPSSNHLSRRDFLKLSGIAAAIAAVLAGCGPAASGFSETDTSQTRAGEVPIPNPEDLPVFGKPKRPWITDVSSGLAVPASKSLVQEVYNTFPRWVNFNIPVVELHPGNQMVIRVQNNGGVGNELGIITSQGAYDKQAERSNSGWNFGQSARGEQFVRPDSASGILTSYLDYQMSAPSASDSTVSSQVKIGRDIGDVHTLRNERGEPLRLPGNAHQVLSLTRMLTLLRARIVNDNLLGLSEPDSFARYNEMKTQLIDNLLAVPKGGVAQIRHTAELYLQNLQFDLSNLELRDQMFKELEPMIESIVSVDSTSIPSARLAVTMAMGLTNGERTLVPANNSDEVIIKSKALEAYTATDLKAGDVVPFGPDNAIDKAVESEWQRIPLVKPRAFVVNVRKYKVDHGQNLPEETTGYVRRVIFVDHKGEQIVDSQKQGHNNFERLFPHEMFEIEPSQLESQRIIESSQKDNLFFTTKKMSSANVETGEVIEQLNEIDPTQIRLYSVPGGGMRWGIETVNSGNKPYGFGAHVESALGGQNFSSIPFQDILLEDGSRFTSEVEGYLNKGWASDITQQWLRWKADGLKEVTKMGLLTPDQYLSRVADGGQLKPQSSLLRDTLLGRYAQMDITNTDIDSLKKNNVISALEQIPLYQVSGGVGQHVDFLMPGDVITYDNSVTVVNGQPMLKLFSSGGYEYAIPIDFSKIQMIDNGTWDRIIQTAQDVLPLALLLIPYGKTLGKGATSLLKLITKK